MVKSIFTCPCGFTGNAFHAKSCEVYSTELTNLTLNISKYIDTLYLSLYSVSECCNAIRDKESTQIGKNQIRKIVNTLLDQSKIREKANGKNLNYIRQQKVKATMLDRYGVENNGQRVGHGWKNNQSCFVKLDLDIELDEYRKRVDYLTRKHVLKLKAAGLLPPCCYYTKIKFIDEEQTSPNPNHPFKRSADHKIPVVEMFLKGESTEVAASANNVVFCLRVVNTYKSNTNLEYFEREIVPYLIERLA